MVHIKLSATFVLAAAAIGPVVALPMLHGGQVFSGRTGHHHVGHGPAVDGSSAVVSSGDPPEGPPSRREFVVGLDIRDTHATPTPTSVVASDGRDPPAQSKPLSGVEDGQPAGHAKVGKTVARVTGGKEGETADRAPDGEVVNTVKKAEQEGLGGQEGRQLTTKPKGQGRVPKNKKPKNKKPKNKKPHGGRNGLITTKPSGQTPERQQVKPNSLLTSKKDGNPAESLTPKPKEGEESLATKTITNTEQSKTGPPPSPQVEAREYTELRDLFERAILEFEAREFADSDELDARDFVDEFYLD